MTSPDERAPLVRTLTDLVATHLLDGQGTQIEETSPLVEWGVIDSFNMFRLLGLIEETCAVTIPVEAVTGDDFRSVGAMADLVLRHRRSAG